MENDLESEIRRLAYSIWWSAGKDAGRSALDFWAMAAQMIIELTADSIRLANTAAWPLALRAFYLYRVRELARCMWSASSEQSDRSIDFWLAAEKHLRLLTKSATRTVGLGKTEAIAKFFEAFSPTDYLEQIRQVAHQFWDAAENQQQSAFDCWLAAENRIIGSSGRSG